jgi:hypothetical protein
MTCCAFCPKLQSKTNIRKKTSQQNETRNETNLDNTCTYSLLKNTQKTRGMKKNNKRKRVKK